MGSSQVAHLNHVFAAVDGETASAIAHSEFLRAFANLEVRTTTGTRATWTGRYLYGRETYLEIFGPADLQLTGGPAPIGAWGIALSGDLPGHVAQLKARIEQSGLKAFEEVETRTFGERKEPWFTALTAISQHGDSGDLNEPVTVWAMEYFPSYFDLPAAAKEPAEHSQDIISRERYQADGYRRGMMRDVTGAEFDLPMSDYQRIEPMLAAAGFRISRTRDGFAADGDQADFVFHVGGEMRLRSVSFALNAPQKRHVERIGRSRMTVGPGATARWVFDPRAP